MQRLRQKGLGAELSAALTNVTVIKGGHHNRGDVLMLALQIAEQIEAGEFGHMQI